MINRTQKLAVQKLNIASFGASLNFNVTAIWPWVPNGCKRWRVMVQISAHMVSSELLTAQEQQQEGEQMKAMADEASTIYFT